MQDFGSDPSSAIDRGRAEIKSRLLSSASLTAPPRPLPQEAEERGPQAYPEGKLPLSTDERPEPGGASAASDGEAVEERSGRMKWIEPVFIEPVFDEGSAEQDSRTDTGIDAAGDQDFQTDAGVDAAPASASVPLPGAGGVAAEAVDLHPTTVPNPSRLARFRWGRRPPASSELEPGTAPQAKEFERDRAALADEVAALRRSLATERTAAADEIAAMRLTLAAEREAAAEEIVTLRETLKAERAAAADEIATLRTILRAQREAAAARTARLKAVLGATSSATPSD